MTTPPVETTQRDAPFDILILGGGFGGMHMLHKLRSLGFKVIALEAGSDVGGAWYWNRYPGARCDVESLVYCYSFSDVVDAEWKWSEQYAPREEIARYQRFVCDRLDLRKDICFNSRLVQASFDETNDCWTFLTESGSTYTARHFVSAAGPISAPIMPNIPGRDSFQGEFYHTALWPRDREPDFTGKRVGVIGTGSSGTQLIPLVAQQASELVVFVRTPNYYSPARNRPLKEEDLKRWEAMRQDVRRKLRTGEMMGTGDIFLDSELQEKSKLPGAAFTPAQRLEILERRWLNGGAIAPRAFCDVMTNKSVNEEVSEFLRSKVATIVKDPKTAEILTPRGFSFGTKRICVGTEFYETFNRPNVQAMDVREAPIERFTERGVVVGGKEVELDVIIAASGFDALTGALTMIDIRGKGGVSIRENWSSNSDTYLGIGISGFPNLHMIGGPGSPSVLVNVVMCNEAQGDWIANLLEHMRQHGLKRVEVQAQAQVQWTEKVRNAVQTSVLADADSWYVGSNVPGKAKGILAYAGGIANYLKACGECAENGYEGFTFS